MTHETEPCGLLPEPLSADAASLSPDRIRMIINRFDGMSERELELLRFASRHPKSRGAWLLRLLIKHPGRKYPGLLLSAILNGHCAADCLSLPDDRDCHGTFSVWGTQSPASSGLILETSIPAADPATLRAVQARLEYLDSFLKHRRGCSRHPLALERRALKQYLAQTSTPGGKPRAFPGSYHRAGQALSRALQRFLALVHTSDPALAAYARHNLCLGMRFGWKAEQDADQEALQVDEEDNMLDGFVPLRADRRWR